MTVPLAWYPTLAKATPAQRSRWELLGGGAALNWDAFDLQIGVEDILAGRRERPVPPGFRERTIAALKAAGLPLPPGW